MDVEVFMETPIIQEIGQPPHKTSSGSFCVHQRIIEGVLTRGGKRSGKVRCLECGAIFDDPYKGMK
jgi:hypothetical protein